MNPVLSISSPGFQKSSPGFVKHESGYFSSPGPGFSRVRIFFESESGSESGPGFEVCRFNHFKLLVKRKSHVHLVSLLFTLSAPNKQVGNLSEHARRKSIWRHILGVLRGFIWF